MSVFITQNRTIKEKNYHWVICFHNHIKNGEWRKPLDRYLWLHLAHGKTTLSHREDSAKNLWRRPSHGCISSRTIMYVVFVTTALKCKPQKCNHGVCSHALARIMPEAKTALERPGCHFSQHFGWDTYRMHRGTTSPLGLSILHSSHLFKPSLSQEAFWKIPCGITSFYDFLLDPSVSIWRDVSSLGFWFIPISCLSSGVAYSMLPISRKASGTMPR